MSEEFISEKIIPVKEKLDGSQSDIGEPFFPREFVWQKKTVKVDQILRKWKESSPCRMGGNEKYIRRHWYEIATDHGRMKIYFERQATGKSKAQRWRIYSLVDVDE